MTREQVLDFCRSEAQVPFSGWDFSYIEKTGRMQTDPLPWDYREIAIDYVQTTKALLDMGTGGGELLASFPTLPYHVHATESHLPNIDIARNRLSRLGVVIHPVEDDAHLPLQDGYFDLVFNRHASYDPSEVYRIMRPGGIFLTQQVGGEDNLALNRHLEIPRNHTYLHWNLATATDQLREQGFLLLDAREANPEVRFFDIGAVVYFVKQIPWQFPDFSVEKQADALYSLHRYIETYKSVTAHAPRFLLIARKPSSAK